LRLNVRNCAENFKKTTLVTTNDPKQSFIVLSMIGRLVF
jgi:hypothetical protein